MRVWQVLLFTWDTHKERKIYIHGERYIHRESDEERFTWESYSPEIQLKRDIYIYMVRYIYIERERCEERVWYSHVILLFTWDTDIERERYIHRERYTHSKRDEKRSSIMRVW